MPGKVIQVAKVPIPEPAAKGKQTEETIALFCTYYPAYTFKMARTMPAKRLYLMLKKARQVEAARYYNLTQIAAAPHSDKGKNVKTLLDEFEGIMKNG